MSYKYLSNGKKVAVIGKLNNQETIVQEIFVDDKGNEIPSGENFVVKSLHDTPVMSWEEKNKKSIEESIKNLKLEQEKYEKKIREKRQRLEAVSDMVRSSEKMIKSLPEQELKLFSMFITGTIRYLVIDKYNYITKPVEMEENIISWDNYYGDRKYDGIKLLSVLGKSNGNLEYRINQYSDGSGSSEKVHPFSNYSDAVNFIKSKAEGLIEENRLGEKEYQICKELDINFTEEQEKKYKNYRLLLVNEQTEKKILEVERIKSEINQLLNKKKELE
jgi:hypothetical protein